MCGVLCEGSVCVECCVRVVWGYLLIGASEASPYLVFNVAILSVCLYVCMSVCHVCLSVCHGPAQ